MGDGGGHKGVGPAQVPGGNAQSSELLLGKILRIDPRPGAAGPYGIPPDNPYVGGGGRPEIWASGVRSPEGLAFDPRSNRLETVTDLSILDRIKVSTHVGYNVFGTASAFWLDRINALNAKAAARAQ